MIAPNIDFSKKPLKPKLQLCKNDLSRTIIANLSEAYNINVTLHLGNINELRFSLPYEIDKNHTLVRNENVDKIKDRYLIKYTVGDYVEYFLIKSPKDIMNNEDSKQVKCYSLGIELADKDIIDYSVQSYNATSILTDVLSESIWNIDYIDVTFDLMYRTFEFTSTTVLDAVFSIAETFNALILFNTINRTISFYDPNNIGSDLGLKVKYGKLLKGLSHEKDTKDLCTRLKVFGKNGISVQRINSTGTNFLQDFSYFLYPFQRDINKNVLSHSDYLSDSLCHAILDYEELLQAKQGEFDNLLSQKETLQQTLSTKENELHVLETELAIIEDELSVANATGSDTTQLVADRQSKLNEISTKESEISQIESDISSIDTQINTLKSSLSMESNFTQDQLIELNPYIITKEYSNEYIDDDVELYEIAKKEFEKMREPKIILDIDIVNLFDVIEEQKNWDKLNLGDIITIQHEKLNINVKAKIIQIDIDYEKSNINLKISNVKELLSDKERFLKDLYKTISTSNTVNYNKYKWNEAKATSDDISNIINNTWDAVERNIKASANETVEISRKGIIIRDINDPLKYIVMQHGQVALTSDGGNTWKTAILPDRIVAERILGKIILGNNMIIGDNDGTFEIVGNLLTIKDANDVIRLLLGEYEVGKYGLKLLSKDGNTTILDEDGLIQTDTIQEADNVDSSHPLKLKFYIDDNVLRIDKVKLNFSLEKFRAYSTGAASGGGYVDSTLAGGGVIKSSAPSNYTMKSGWLPGDWMDHMGDHTHTINSAGGHSHTYTYQKADGTWVDQQTSTNGSHTHTMDSAGGHVHGRDTYHVHEIDIPDHTHEFSIPDHTHPIRYGIYEGSVATGVKVKVDGIERLNNGGIGYSSDQSNLDLTQWITTSGWHTVEITSTQLGRINASLYIKSFVGM